MRALLKAEARRRRQDLELERFLKRHRDLALEIVEHVGRRLKAGPAAEELVHLARALDAAAGVQRVAADSLLRLYSFRVARELAGDDEEEDLGAGSVH